MCSQNSTKMILLGLTLSCMILYVTPQQYLQQNGQYLQTNNPDSLYFNDRPNEYSAGSISPTALKYPQYPMVQNNPVQIEKSHEISSSTIVQQPNSNNEIGVPNNAVRPGYEQLAQGQVIGSPARQPQAADTDKRLLFPILNMGLNMLKTVDALVPGNVVLSPYSISLLLGLLQQGAKGQTQAELTGVLRLQPHEISIGYSRISNDYKHRNSRNILNTATCIFVGEQYSIKPDFKKIAMESFDSDITVAPYTKPAQAARKINKWVSDKTNHKIENIINPDTTTKHIVGLVLTDARSFACVEFDLVPATHGNPWERTFPRKLIIVRAGLDPNTQVVLVNTIFFKGLWEIPFRPKATSSRDFYLSSGETKPAQFMRMRNYTKAGVDSVTNAKVVIMPFVDNQYSMMLVLPSANAKFSSWLASLTDDRLLSYHSFSTVDVALEIPKFKVRGDLNLESVLKRMGIQTMFSENAELDIVQSKGYSQPSRISEAVHSAVLSIDEQGGTAAAATAFAAVALSYDEPSFSFNANRPFLAILWDEKSAIPLFMAKIEDPTIL